jgi:hypothetical protein
LNAGLRYELYTTLLWVHFSRITDYKTEMILHNPRKTEYEVFNRIAVGQFRVPWRALLSFAIKGLCYNWKIH